MDVPATGVRLPWQDVPEEIRRAVEDRLGAPVARAVTQTGGFSPGAAARLTLADGRRAFVKAVGPEPNPLSADIYRAEARISAALPEDVPAPRLLASFDSGGWVALLFEDVDGRPPAAPWRADELARVLDALDRLAAALTPSPIPAPPAQERLDGQLRGWRLLAEARDAGEDDLAGLDPWAARHLDALADLEEGWPEAIRGESLVHGDIRADNLLLTPGEVVVVDWPWAFTGAPWFDLLQLLPSVRMQGGPPAEEVFTAHPVGRAADPEAVTAVLAALAGYFVRQARQPDPPGLPTLRAFQRAQGRTALEWLRTRTGWA
ncbi:aminoglycoside phosphotransferase [Planomonospora sphaerica]|uniref:Aminoglycoside phosphotransferase n=1 Tax=Planomonospora sphaerica TaxID=161355 RepID=A0A161MER9_9ACTN|nr:aminoglycoside phosphotransferase family protein [Planomonospora sphaerica]GAT70573.1 aminoglycoside phosphotransferase [Planomonospora sphaerica]